MKTNEAAAKHSTSGSKHYPILLVFTREWTHATDLAGLTHDDSIPFCTREDAASWVASINAQHAKSFAKKNGRMTYRVIDHAILSQGKDW